MANRYIGDNIRLIYDLISYLYRENKPGLLLCLDFEKAFESVDWKFMFKVLRAFGFGPDICQWIFTFYKDIKSSVTVNGQLSILAIMIRQKKHIKGIFTGETEYKISQCADDTEITLKGDKNSFEETVKTINTFRKHQVSS